MNRFPLVDAHVHLWRLDHLHYPWLTPPFNGDGPNGSVAAIAVDYDVANYRADAAAWNVVGTVHVEAGADATQAVDETRWLDKQATDHGLPDGIVAFAALDDPDVERVLAAQAAYPRVRGVRQIVNWHADPRRTYTRQDVTQSEQWRAGLALLGQYKLSFDLQCYPAQMAGLASFLARHEEVAVVINHLGMPVLSDPDGVERWRAGMQALAALPQVAVKLSGFGFVDRDWTFDRIRPFLTDTLEMFGPDRCLFASDAPTDKLFAPFNRCLDALARFAGELTAEEQRLMWGRNADRIYRLGLGL